jgi:hypothetical protein
VSFGHMAVGWLLWVSLLVGGVWFRLRGGVTVGWQLWCGSVGCGLGPWVGCGGGRVCCSPLWVPTGGTVGGWLVWGAVRRVAVRRCRMWCVMLVVCWR